MSIPLIIDMGLENLDKSFNEIRIGGTCKHASPKRFTTLDGVFVSFIRSHFDIYSRLVIHDMAASNGFSSIDLFYQLRPYFSNLYFIASDYYPYIYLVRLYSSGWIVVLDPDLNHLQYVGYRMVLSDPESNYYFFNRILKKLLDKTILKRAKDSVRRVSIDTDEVTKYRSYYLNGFVERIPLIADKCIGLTKQTTNFTYRRQNIFTTTEEPCHVIRAMNIVNKLYFSDYQILECIRAIWHSLYANGLLLIGRTIDSKNIVTQASLFRKTEIGFDHVMDICGGSEVKELAMSIRF